MHRSKKIYSWHTEGGIHVLDTVEVAVDSPKRRRFFYLMNRKVLRRGSLRWRPHSTPKRESQAVTQWY